MDDGRTGGLAGGCLGGRTLPPSLRPCFPPPPPCSSILFLIGAQSKLEERNSTTMHDLQSIIRQCTTFNPLYRGRLYPKLQEQHFQSQNKQEKSARKQYLGFSLACPRCFIEFPKDRRTQNDAPRHHTRKARKLAVLYRIHEFLQKSTKNVTKKLTKKNEKSIFWYPKVFIENYCKMSPEIKISKRILHFVKM